jgi:hypothetical protein
LERRGTVEAGLPARARQTLGRVRTRSSVRVFMEEGEEEVE